MDISPSPDTVKAPGRAVLSTRRPNRSFSFEHEGHEYRATAGFYPDGITLGELFLDTGKINTPLQQNAETSAILVSLLLQHGVTPETIRHSISGPIAIALQVFMGETP
jgi:hypothetical protein